MIEGILRHCTDAEIQRNFVDTHGQSEIGFACCHLLGFRLLPRLKDIGAQKLYRPEAGSADAYERLQPVLTRAIDWELIRNQYDEMVKYATALRLGTADAESILRRFTRANLQHPTYRALAELGKALKTVFLAEYLQSEALRQEIHQGLNVIENWNSANSFIFYGRNGEIATNGSCRGAAPPRMKRSTLGGERSNGKDRFETSATSLSTNVIWIPAKHHRLSLAVRRST